MMSTRKRTRRTAEEQQITTQNIATKMSKLRKSTTTDTNTADEQKIDLSGETMNTDECMRANTVNTVADDPDEHQHNMDSFGDTSDDLAIVSDDILREADILIAQVDEFRREMNSFTNNDSTAENNEVEAVDQAESADAVHHTSQTTDSNASVNETANVSTSSSTQARANESSNLIDDSVVVIEELSTAVQPNNRDDDEDVIFVTETRQRQRTIATIDLCDTPDTSYSQPRAENQKTSIIDSPSPSTNSGRATSHKCPICLEVTGFDRILSTMCGHLYCEPCIRNVIKIRKKCPMCNRALKPNQVHRIFLES